MVSWNLIEHLETGLVLLWYRRWVLGSKHKNNWIWTVNGSPNVQFSSEILEIVQKKVLRVEVQTSTIGSMGIRGWSGEWTDT